MTDLRARGLRPALELVADRPHGIRLRYIAGCRCDDCRRANAEYEKERARARRAGDWNGVVSARRARVHLLKLSRAGVGRNQVADAAGVPRSTLAAIRSGAKQSLRARTARRILAVTTLARADRALIAASTTWRRIEWLLEQGFTRSRIAAELGYKTRALQLNHERVTLRNAAKVERLYRRFVE